jgi:hypothetical protein
MLCVGRLVVAASGSIQIDLCMLRRPSRPQKRSDGGSADRASAPAGIAGADDQHPGGTEGVLANGCRGGRRADLAEGQPAFLQKIVIITDCTKSLAFMHLSRLCSFHNDPAIARTGRHRGQRRQPRRRHRRGATSDAEKCSPIGRANPRRSRGSARGLDPPRLFLSAGARRWEDRSRAPWRAPTRCPPQAGSVAFPCARSTFAALD